MSSQTAVVQSHENIRVSICVTAEPDSTFETNYPILERISLLVEALDAEFSKQLFCFVVILVALDHRLHPCGTRDGYGISRAFLWSSGESISCSISCAFLVHNMVL